MTENSLKEITTNFNFHNMNEYSLVRKRKNNAVIANHRLYKLIRLKINLYKDKIEQCEGNIFFSAYLYCVSNNNDSLSLSDLKIFNANRSFNCYRYDTNKYHDIQLVNKKYFNKFTDNVRNNLYAANNCNATKAVIRIWTNKEVLLNNNIGFIYNDFFINIDEIESCIKFFYNYFI